jgi:2-polyprenyl-3-methyl-5-hydroxy-6-metoxy-1,4-benzoquinol methylase
MMNAFDSHDDIYRLVVQDSIRFSGLKRGFFLKAKVPLLSRWMAGRFLSGKPVRAQDVGCGVGALHRELSDLVGELHGTDLSAACIARAESEHLNVQYRIGDGTAPPTEKRLSIS